MDQDRPDVLRLSEALTDDPEPPRSTRRGRRVLLAAVIMLVAVALLATAGVWLTVEHYTGNVRRIPHAFPDVPEGDRPSKQGDSLTFLLVGVDRRSDVPTTGRNAQGASWKPGAQRSDSLMLVRLTGDRRHAYVVSIPRDSWVPIPGHGSAKVNAAFSFGGPPLLIQTVERFTGVRIDHLAVIDWDGFRALTDALGGVTVTIPQDTYDTARSREWKAGTYSLKGNDALDYVRQRYGLPRGDLDRVARQQNFLRAVMDATLRQGTLTNPLKLPALLGAVTDTVSVDDQLSNADLRGLALRLRHLRRDDVTFMTAPVGRLATIQGQSAVILDATRSAALWRAMRIDDLPAYLDRYGADQLGTTVE